MKQTFTLSGISVPNLIILIVTSVFSVNFGFSQELYIGSGAEFYIQNNTKFTTGNTVVSMDPAGRFVLDAGSNWGSATEYVDGQVDVTGTGKTKLPTGDGGKYAPVTADHTGTVTAIYHNSTPATGSPGNDVDAVSDVEYWELSGNAIITLPWDDASDITSLVNNNGGNLSSVAIVGHKSGTWNLVSNTKTNTVTGDLQNGDVTSDVNNAVNLDGFTQYTFGIDHQVALSVNKPDLGNKISILSNPVRSSENTIRFVTKNEMKDMKISIYDITGRSIKKYQNITTSGRIGALKIPKLKSGLYFIKFDHDGKQGVKRIIIE